MPLLYDEPKKRRFRTNLVRDVVHLVVLGVLTYLVLAVIEHKPPFDRQRPALAGEHAQNNEM